MIIDWKEQKLWEKAYKKKIELLRKHLHMDIVRKLIIETVEYQDFINYEQSSSIRSGERTEIKS